LKYSDGLHVETMVKPIDKLDDVPATQRLYSFQHFGRESLCVVGKEVGPDFIWPRPHETTEWTSPSGHVLVPYVSIELLHPSKVLVAMHADRPHLAAVHRRISPAFCGSLDGEIPFCTFGLCLMEVL
jgi:hypothetical protein